jgi:hypothetical protein
LSSVDTLLISSSALRFFSILHLPVYNYAG